MSVEIIKGRIFEFLSSETPEVMAIKGEWGVGKTYSWKTFLNDANSEGLVKLNRYSYVSLFGINSLEAFKYTIFENVVKREMIGTEANLDTFRSNATSLIEPLGRRFLNLIKGAPIIKSFNPAIETMAFLSLNNTLICIDDLERRGAGLDTKDVLGLVSLLKEQKKCKVVLIFNDGEEELEDYSKYREKVIDFELTFAPNPKECALIAYPEDKAHFGVLRERVAKLGIRNIRVLKKIERLVDWALPRVDEFDPEITDQVIHSLVLFSWCYFCSDANKDIPPLEYVFSKRYGLSGIGDEKDETENQKWKTTLQLYNHQWMDDLDIVICEAVKRGFFIESELKEKAKTKNEEILTSNSTNSFSEAWRLYHDTFNDNGKEVIDRIYQGFKDNCKHITPLNLDGTVSLFRGLDENEKASKIIDIYIENRKDETSLFNLKESSPLGDVKDQEIISKFNKTYNSSVITETAKEVLDRIAGQNGWGQSDEIVLANTSVDEYYNLFKSESGQHLRDCVATCLKFGQCEDASEQQKKIANRATEALKKIASESKINSMRVKNFGVHLENI